jgi:hypothetical protein
MAYLTRKAILEAQDLPTEDVEVSGWGGVVRVRGLTGAERDAYERELFNIRGKSMELNLDNARAKMVARAVIDENGKRLFSDDDVRELGKKSGAALEMVFQVARRLSGMNETDIEELTAGLKNDQPGASLIA